MRSRRNQRGLTYLALVFAVAILGGISAAAGVVWHQAQQREKEIELIHVGREFRRAIGLYYQRTPGPVKRFPNALEDLVEDKRFPTPQRYLRKLYRDPMTGRAEWGLVKAPEGGIIGVHSLSEATAIKTGNFRPEDAAFEGRATYKEWQFSYTAPRVQAAKPAAPQPGAAGQPGVSPAPPQSGVILPPGTAPQATLPAASSASPQSSPR
jgi:type II secretory pathway pseudopilin PulG